MNPLVSICIAAHNQAQFLGEAISSCYSQSYSNIEIILLDDASTDTTRVDWEASSLRKINPVKYFRSEEPSGTGGAFNKAISYATGDIIVLLCSDDYFTDRRVISDIVEEFKNIRIGHVSRWYYQFVDGDKHPVRAWRGKDIIELANNPSGMAFRSKAIFSGENLTNKMFIEVAQLVKKVKDRGWGSSILSYDTVAVRIHNSISRTPGYYKKMWKSSPVEEWAKLGWNTKDFTHLIQVGTNFEKKAVAQEAAQFLNADRMNAFNPAFWFFFAVALWTPRNILYKLPEIYRATWGRLTTRQVGRKYG